VIKKLKKTEAQKTLKKPSNIVVKMKTLSKFLTKKGFARTYNIKSPFQ